MDCITPSPAAQNIVEAPDPGAKVMAAMKLSALPSSQDGAFPSQIRAQGPGQITSLASPIRQIQFGLKFLF